ncbi:TetR/AcrR family transcriptional regulator [Paenarthrobacter nitroguajacolicus]|uniref:TetR/AcrR family transcriptional regulator n=1 Tax=Paenarthrobacter nitroguajacolicus TaxID=211146 RepID=UPI00248B3BE9|nr:TetR/AcrR family transcriptional regulator [Paenarthrobacter nitroguajacolicus]MDI2033539.1 HTH-type transcriptional repressor KstR2 [Paenarthrobacter nitroguajacolicus]
MTSTADADPGIRARVLDAAASAFARRGFAKTTIDDIAMAVGATKGLVYYHFRSKFDIFLAAYELGMHKVKAVVEPLADSPGSGLERLKRMATGHVINLMEDVDYHHVVHQGVRDQSSESLTVGQREALVNLNQLRKDYELLFRRVVEEGVTDGSLRKVDPPLATRVLLSSLNAVDVWYHEQEKQHAEGIRALAGDVVDLILGGIASP